MRVHKNQIIVSLIGFILILSPFAFNFLYYTNHHKKILEKRAALYDGGDEREALGNYLYDYLEERRIDYSSALLSKEVEYSEEFYKLRKKVAYIKRAVATSPIDLEDPLIKQYLAEYRELVEQGVIEGR